LGQVGSDDVLVFLSLLLDITYLLRNLLQSAFVVAVHSLKIA
jgi:hypothetical protein